MKCKIFKAVQSFYLCEAKSSLRYVRSPLFTP